MLRSIAGVVLGYIAMFLLVFVLFSAAYLWLGAERAFLPGSYRVSPLWVAVSIAVHLVAPLAGGYVAAAVSRWTRAALALACLALVLGILFGIVALGHPDPGPRPGAVDNFTAMQNGRHPLLIMFLNPVIAAFGILVGSRMRRPT